MDISDYKCAVVEYSCKKCFIAQNYIIHFDINRGAFFESEKGKCNHMNLLLHSSTNKTFFNFFIEIQCQKCQKKEIKNLIDKDVKEVMTSLHYTCECGEGDLFIGILLQKGDFDLSDKEEEKSENDKKENGNIAILENDTLKRYSNEQGDIISKQKKNWKALARMI